MERRDFLKSAGKVCAGVSLAWAFGGLASSCSGPMSILKLNANDGWISFPLITFEKTNYAMLRVNNFGFDIGVQKDDNGRFVVMVLMCPHARQPLTKTSNGYVCTLHGSRFSKDGDLLKGPSSLPLYELPFKEENGNLLIQISAFNA